ncbi:MAG: hypothetical protein J5765_02185 [Clostridia bacterium]|nr:hypothetical protein [Clostridia bacterium]
MRKLFLPLFLFALFALLLLSPERYFHSVQGGVLLFTSAVLPSMLPYFFFTKLLTGTGCVGALSGTLGRPVRWAYRVAPIASYPLLMSLLSGYPVGARVLGDLYDKGLISREDARHAASFTSTSGSMFVLGSVGAVILKDAGAGVVILVAHYLGAIVNGFFYRGKADLHGQSVLLSPSSVVTENLLSDAMYESVLSLALVGGFIAIANLLGDMASDLLSRLFPTVFSGGTVWSGLLYGAFEVTRGCVEFSSLGVGRVWVTALCALAVSFGGLSVLFQSMSFLGKTGIKGGKFLLMKVTQSGVSFLLALALGFVFLQ